MPSYFYYSIIINMKKRTIILLIFIVIIFLLCLFIALIPTRVAVLGYHSFYKDEVESKSTMTANIKDFEKQMKWLYESGYKTLSLDEFYQFMEGDKLFPKKSVLLTFDDGYLSNYMYVVDVLKKYNFKGTIFIIGGYTSSSDGEGNNNSYMSLEQIKSIRKDYSNIEFASHTYNMHDMDINSKTKEVVEEDIKNMNKVIKTKYVAYPYGLYNDSMKEAYKDNGYKLAFGFGMNKNDFRKASNKDDKYNVPRLCIDGNMSLIKFKIRLMLPF